jgi:tRNA(Ile)-lysidine synthase
MNDVRELDGLKVIRPLLNVPREQLEDYARQEKVPYREDPTNTDEDFLRNRVRQELLPLLKRSYNPNIEEVLANTAVTISGDYRFLAYAATKEFRGILKELNPECKVTLDLPGLMALDVAMKRLVIRISVEALIGHSRSMTLTHVQEIEDLLLNRRAGSEVHLPHGVKVTKGADVLEFGY